MQLEFVFSTNPSLRVMGLSLGENVWKLATHKPKDGPEAEGKAAEAGAGQECQCGRRSRHGLPLQGTWDN